VECYSLGVYFVNLVDILFIFRREYNIGNAGTLSGEHGIGISKAEFMPLAFTPAEMELFRSIKKAFDPNNILNPFKMGL